jgi:hypothetical protein
MRRDIEGNPTASRKEIAMRFHRIRHLVPLFVAMLAVLLLPATGGSGGPDPPGKGYRAVTFYVA